MANSMETSKVELKHELLNALKNRELILYYQPQFNLTTTKFEGVEALIRWQHPQRGLLLPAEFIDAALEDEELIIPITQWVLQEACKQNKTWQKKGLPPMRMAVNITEKDIKHSDFVESVIKVLRETDLKPEFLEIELTENILIQDENIIHHIHQLKNLGVIIALDDFGTGYSSISYLKKIPIDRIKIAKMYIDNIHSNSDDAAIVRAIISLAEGLNIQVVAEGVESLKQLQLLTSNKSLEIQGFYFSEPLLPNELEKFFVLYKKKQNI